MNELNHHQNRRSWLRWLGSWSSLPIGLVAITYGIQGRPMAEKMATGLLSPISVVWWVSLILAIKLWRSNERRTACVIFALVLLIYIACTPVISKLSMKYLESQIPSTKLDADSPLDTLVVLGGGTSEAPDGRSQFSSAGDRVGLAAQLFPQRLVKHLVVTGDALPGLAYASQNDPSIQSKSILIKLGIPESVIEELPGSNTSQEIRSLKERIDLWKDKRCGLLTSASHMPRAIRLAKREGIDVLPVLADFRALTSPFNLRDFLPSSSGANLTDLALHEFLGMLIGR